MTKSGTPSKESVKSDTPKTEVASRAATSTVKTRDGSAHPHPGSDTRVNSYNYFLPISCRA